MQHLDALLKHGRRFTRTATGSDFLTSVNTSRQDGSRYMKSLVKKQLQGFFLRGNNVVNTALLEEAAGTGVV